MDRENLTLAAAIKTARDLGKGMLIGVIPGYVLAVMWTHSCTPGLGNFLAPPEGYQNIGAYRRARSHDFPALHEEPGPSPVGGGGHLFRIRDGVLHGTTATETPPGRRPDVRTLHIERLFGPNIIAHLDLPLRPGLQEHLRSLRKGAIVTIAGIGHGDGEHNIYIYPVHQVNGHAP